MIGKANDGSHHLQNIGVELYTVRDILPKDPSGTLRAIEQMGYTEAEIIYGGIDKMWPALKATKLKPVSVHLGTDLFEDQGKMQATLHDIKQRGFEFAVFPYLPPAQRGGLEAIKKLAGKLNMAGKISKGLGIRMCYHNHAFEFEPMEGTTPFDTLLKETDRNLVSLELDVFWVSVAGHNPVELIRQHANRIALVHLKDKPASFPVRYNEQVPADTFKEVGRGSIDFPGVLRAATAAGVNHFFVEQDKTPGNPLDSLKISYEYLRNLAF
jgi:sugar phosphate isomerase/epimerase